MRKNRIVIVVQQGMVSSVYAENGLVDVEILDLDTDDPCQESHNEKCRRNLMQDVQSKRLISVY